MMETITHVVIFVIFVILCAIIIYQWLGASTQGTYEKILLKPEIFNRDCDIRELEEAKEFLIKEHQKLMLENMRLIDQIYSLNKQVEVAMGTLPIEEKKKRVKEIRETLKKDYNIHQNPEIIEEKK